ncbi:MAG: DUF1294 domain-containing protein [Lachnospiraceae bacterium]|nr:DUF1294 domain-containing protein [Lachnospiraceae bacterium]
MIKFVCIYLLIINLAALFAMGLDKSKAKRRAWRIPERTLFLLSFIGGSIGALAGMYLFRHKTKHKKFVIGMPLILILYLVIACFVIRI